jgi:hypothetical protein
MFPPGLSQITKIRRKSGKSDQRRRMGDDTKTIDISVN